MEEYKVWAYARSAVPNLTALENQLEEVMREADKRGYILVNTSMELKRGTAFWRPALFAMLKAVRQGRVNAVMVQSLDRLSHDTATLYRILRFLQNHGAALITTKTSLKPNTPEKSCRGRDRSMLIDSLPIKLEQELKYELAYTALSSAATTGKLPRGICQRANVGYARKCNVLCRDV